MTTALCLLDTWRRIVATGDPDQAEARLQVPWGVDAVNGAVTTPAWKTKPSWYLVSTDDKMIPPDGQRAMSKRAGSTVVEVRGSHAVLRDAAASCRGHHRQGGQRRGAHDQVINGEDSSD